MIADGSGFDKLNERHESNCNVMMLRCSDPSWQGCLGACSHTLPRLIMCWFAVSGRISRSRAQRAL